MRGGREKRRIGPSGTLAHSKNGGIVDSGFMLNAQAVQYLTMKRQSHASRYLMTGQESHHHRALARELLEISNDFISKSEFVNLARSRRI